MRGTAPANFACLACSTRLILFKAALAIVGNDRKGNINAFTGAKEIGDSVRMRGRSLAQFLHAGLGLGLLGTGLSFLRFLKKNKKNRDL
jgi:hypothetical protein